MNPKRLILAIVAVFLGVFITDFLIHGVWLDSTYKETMSLWRPEAEMKTHFPWLSLGQLLYAVTFVVIWSKGFPATASLGGAGLYGLFMGVFSQAYSLIMYAVQPLPGSLVAKWIGAGLVQGILMGLLVFFVYKPNSEKPGEAKPNA